VKPVQRDLTAAPGESFGAAELRRPQPGSLFDRIVPGRLRFLAGLALVMCVVMVIVAQIQGLPIRDPDDALGPSWVRLPLILLVAVLIDVVPRVAYRSWTGLGALESLKQVLVERWPRAQVRFTLVGLVAWYVAYGAFRNLKSAVPFVNDALWDSRMAAWDRVLWLGHDPGPVLHAVLGTGWAAAFFSAIYLLWIGLIPASLAWALAWTRNHAIAAWFVTALAIDWALGVAAYYAFPTLGPIYSNAGDFSSLPENSTWLQATMLDDRVDVLADARGVDALQTIAAFPSLHVGMMVTLCLFVQWNTRSRIARWLCWAMLGLTCLSTMYLGWHFFVDVLGGTAIGALAVVLGAFVSGARRPTHDRAVGALRGE
jgi:membrane-associated phospholipid phosphatase